MDENNKKWLWGAIGIAAGAGLAWWLLKGRQEQPELLPSPAAPPMLPAQPVDAGTEGMVAGYAEGINPNPEPPPVPGVPPPEEAPGFEDPNNEYDGGNGEF